MDIINIIIYINIFVIGAAMGLSIGLTLWLRQIADSITKFEIERANIQAELEALKEQTDGRINI